jgi:hypothetical protein
MLALGKSYPSSPSSSLFHLHDRLLGLTLDFPNLTQILKSYSWNNINHRLMFPEFIDLFTIYISS